VADNTLHVTHGERPLPPLPCITRRGVLLTALGWTLYAAFFTAYFCVMLKLSLLETFGSQVISSLIFALYGIPVWLVVIRGLDRSPWGWRVGAHAVLGPVYMAAVFYTSWGVSVALTGEPELNMDLLIWQLLGMLFTYLIQFSLFHVVRSSQKLRWREQQQVELERLLREQQLAVLRSQLNPHFLFNSLNTISAVLGQNVEQARGLIARLGDVLRYAVDSIDRNVVPLAEEWTLTRSYLDVEQARLGDRLAVQADIPDELLATTVPPMILQPLVENAIIHGIAPLPEGGQVHVSAELVSGRVRLEVRNSGASVIGDRGDWDSGARPCETSASGWIPCTGQRQNSKCRRHLKGASPPPSCFPERPPHERAGHRRHRR
jgi:hypothetical protein